jgi:hypothetical protein
MKKMLVFLGVCSFFLSACGAMKFNHRAKSQEEFYKDWTDCEAKAGQAGYYGGLIQRNFMERCMNGGGWVRE